jgi:hypothetical protein
MPLFFAEFALISVVQVSETGTIRSVRAGISPAEYNIRR